MKYNPNRSAFDAKMDEVDAACDAADPNAKLATVLFGWGALLAGLVVAGMLTFAFGPHIAEITSGRDYEAHPTRSSSASRVMSADALLNDTKDEAWWRAKIGGVVGLLLFLAIIAMWGKEDIAAILKKNGSRAIKPSPTPPHFQAPPETTDERPPPP